MTSRDFCYWLQGHFEIANPQSLSAEQTAMVKNHLALVFKHEIDPSIAKPGTPEAAVLDALHAGKPLPTYCKPSVIPETHHFHPDFPDTGSGLIRC